MPIAAPVRSNRASADFQQNPPTEIVRHAALKVLRRTPSSVQYDDLYSAGLVALVEASHRYDADRGIDFRTYAKHRVYGAMLDELRSLDTISRERRRAIREGTDAPDALPPPRLVEVSAADYVADPAPSLDDEIDRRRAAERMREAEACLPERLRLVLKLRLEDGWTLLEIADHLGVTEARACQLVGEIVRRVREHMGESDGSETPRPQPQRRPVLRAVAGGRRGRPAKRR